MTSLSLGAICTLRIPTEVCTIVSDPTCQLAHSTVCDPVDVDVAGMCLLTVRRAFTGSGTYCVNLTLGDDTSLALTSTLVSVPARGKFCFMLYEHFILQVQCVSHNKAIQVFVVTV